MFLIADTQIKRLFRSKEDPSYLILKTWRGDCEDKLHSTPEGVIETTDPRTELLEHAILHKEGSNRSIKTLKIERDTELVIERRWPVKSYSLTLDKTRCSGCGICVEVCPMEAIELKKVLVAEKNGYKPSFIDVDETQCRYCGICHTMCPFEAISTQKKVWGR